MSASAERSIYLGLELGGSRSSRTSLVVLQLFAQEKKIFLTQIHAGLQGTETQSADDHLLSLINQYEAAPIGISAPLTLPPCMGCVLPCPRVHNCTVPAVKWMRDTTANAIGPNKTQQLKKTVTPYTQRPIDILLRHKWLQEIGVDIPLDETLGASRAPLTARVAYLKRHIPKAHLLEVHPRFSLALMAPWFKISDRELRRMRDVEDGLELRIGILEKISGAVFSAKIPSVFLYRADLLQLAQDIASFDAFFCALMPVYEHLGLLEKPSLDPSWGYLAKPIRMQSPRAANVDEGREL